MSIEFIWQLPTVTDLHGARFNYFDYLHQVARAADLSGFDGIQVRNDPQGDESWILAGYLARSTSHVRLLTEFDASRGSAVYAAKNAVSYQRYTGGRFAWQIGTGGTPEQRRSQGDFAADTDVIPRIEEFLTVARGVLTSGSYSFQGRYFEVLNGGFKGPLANSPVPRVYLSGSTAEACELSARVADVHIVELADFPLEHTLSVQLALRLNVVARETEAEARADAARYPGQSLIGSYEQVATSLADYVKAGVTSFILGSAPHLDEAYRVGEHILPAVRRKVYS